jgi:hypothetical protein
VIHEMSSSRGTHSAIIRHIRAAGKDEVGEAKSIDRIHVAVYKWRWGYVRVGALSARCCNLVLPFDVLNLLS